MIVGGILMARLGFGFSEKGTLKETFADIPDHVRGHIRDGFRMLAKLSTEAWPNLVSLVEASGSQAADIELELVGRRLNISPEDVGEVLGSARLVCGILAFRSDSPRDLVEAAQAIGVLEGNDSERVEKFADFVAKDRKKLKQGFEQASLQNSLLPSLSEFDVGIDLRLHFEDGKVSHAVPVIVAHIDTDSYEQELWFQMTPFQLESLIASLQEALKQLKEAESIARKAV